MSEITTLNWIDWVWENVLTDVDVEQLADCLDDKWREHCLTPHYVIDTALPHMTPDEFMDYVKECK
jgi:hypothetical protein